MMITTEYRGDMAFETSLGRHTLTVDVPPEMGGQDRGPTPPELFIGSLGSCVAALIAQYCERNELDTRGLRVDVSYTKASQPTRLTDISVTVRLPHADCKSCEEALVRVAELCPVHQTMATLDAVRFEVVDRRTSVAAPVAAPHS